MSLEKYREKRALTGSPEPMSADRQKTNSKKHIFVVHEHHASHLHWDLRLQIRGVLKSWAVPKEPPRSKNMKRLAIQVEDHPMSYADFEGTIPEGHYGAGEVRIWDKGELNVIEIDDKKIIFELRGRRLLGRYCLIKANLGGEDKNWLFFRI